MFCAPRPKRKNSQDTQNSRKCGPPGKAGFFRRERYMGNTIVLGIIALVIAIVFIAGGLVLLMMYRKIRDRQYEQEKKRDEQQDSKTAEQ